ncbi:baseplate assembly protein [Stutzerimonas kunmingensis]|uniref:baseplate assembly protein n=1 Tax=Stutzerimonas kunmingensis TaxID=1211807 RepID=UPI0028A94D63|nr:baseplate J/gp47 family protein [Stutzerimonas kunmingensis]
MIDLSQLPAPNVVEALDFEAILAERKARLLELWPTEEREALAARLALESDPITKLLQENAYREIVLRQRINDAARAVMLAYAREQDLDHLGANYGVPRLVGEPDNRYRHRVQQGFHRLAAAGPANAYRQHALGVSLGVVDVEVFSESPGQVTVAVLGRESRPANELSEESAALGVALFGPAHEAGKAHAIATNDSALLRQVLLAVNADDVRPLTDHVIVRAPVVHSLSIDAVIEVLPGPDAELVRHRRLSALREHLASVRRIGHDITRAGIIAALFEPGVKNVHLAEPMVDVVCQPGEIAAVLAITVRAEVVHA